MHAPLASKRSAFALAALFGAVQASGKLCGKGLCERERAHARARAETVSALAAAARKAFNA